MILNRDHFTLKLAETEAELVAAQRLRYRVFVEEMGARPPYADTASGREVDAFDPYFDHLILKDERISGSDNVIGVYRLMRDVTAAKGPGYYSAAEYDLEKITNSGRPAVELGRSCVDAAYRTGLALHLLWQGVADYVVRNELELLFGVVSFAGTDPQTYQDGLSFLHFNHRAPQDLRVAVHDKAASPLALLAEAEVDRKRAVQQIPPLLKSYLRMGGAIGDGAYIDREFNTIDVCLVLDRDKVPARHLVQLEHGLAA